MQYTTELHRGFLLPTCKGAEFIIIAELVRVEAASNYSRLYFSNGKTMLVAKVLRWFELRLCEGGFIRTHRTHLINCRFIDSYVKKGKLILSNGEAFDVSRRKKNCFLKNWQLQTAA